MICIGPRIIFRSRFATRRRVEEEGRLAL
ncbi:hypothetical protein EE612_024952 [Oryza sativa]|nr:hypothetical protein EE612_024952 [Oryza sativa]